MDHLQKRQRPPHPKEKANIFSVVSFFYLLKLFKTTYKKDLEEDELYDVLKTYKSKQLGDQLEKQWEKQAEKGQKNSIIRALWACYGWEYFLLGLAQLIVKTIMIIWQPRALSKLISYFTPGQTKLTKDDAYFYAGLLVGINIIHCVYIHNYHLAITGLGIRVRTAFCSFIYRKALKLSPARLGDISIGKIVTLMTKDVHSFETFIHFANDLWIGVVKTLVVLYIVYMKIGLAAFAGMGFFFLILPLQIYMGKWTSVFRTKMCKKADERLQMTQETLSAIKIIKIYTWEKFFNNRVESARKNEIKSMHALFYLKFIVLQIGFINGKIAFYLLLMTYTWLGNHATPEIVYFIESCFQIITHTMSVLFPLGIAHAAELSASIKRIGNVLKALEIKPTLQNDEKTLKPKVHLKNLSVNFQNKEILHSIDLNVDSGVTLVTGHVGSGKSFLLKTILQDYEPCTGGVITKGRISYASQEPWLFPSSIRQNILFGADYDEKRYNEVLKVCALKYDFELLAAGDNTIVEDRGINLSKGQQARINLARAIYKESEIYLLDDCLSALDAHVSDFIFKECIKKYLKNKLVIFVTHNVNFVDEVANVVVLQHGSIKSFKKSNEVSKEEILQNIKEIEDEPKAPNTDDENEDEENADEETQLITETTTEKKVYGESKKVGAVAYAIYNKYMKFGGGAIAFLGVFLAFSIAQFLHSYADKLVSRWVNLEQQLADFNINNVTNASVVNDTTATRNYVLNLYTAMTFSSLFLDIGKAFMLFMFARRVSVQLHKFMIHHVIYAKMHFFDNNFIGNILNRFSKDLGVIDEHIPFVYFHLIRVFLTMIGIITLIAFVNPYFLIPTAVFLVLLTIIRNYYLPTGRSLKRLDALTRSPVVGHLNATLEGLTTIRAFKAEKILRDEYDRHQDLYTSANYTFQGSMRAFAYFLDTLCNFFIGIIVGRFVLSEDDFSAGSVGLAISQAFRMTGTMQWGVRQWTEVENSMTSVERALEYTEVEQESNQGQDLDNWPNKGEVKYEHVSLSYNNSDDFVLRDISFTANPREKIGIVGRTGAGKSSIIATLFRLYDVDGKITIDSVDTKSLSLEFLRKHISIIPQDPVLFTGTIRDNIDPQNEYTDEEIWKAITTANLIKIIPALDFEITENGSNFSVGQRQLICLARAIIKNNRIIVLDEATANMDPETDALIYDTIHTNFSYCTVFTIAHKLHTIIHSDKIIVMDKGEIIEYDTPGNLLQKTEGTFYKMVEKSGLLTAAT